MTRIQEARIQQVRTGARFYRESLTVMLAKTNDKRLIALIESTLQLVSQIEADPLLYALHDRRRADLLSRWLVTIEERINAIDADYKILIHWLEHHYAGPVPTTQSARRGFVTGPRQIGDAVARGDQLGQPMGKSADDLLRTAGT